MKLLKLHVRDLFWLMLVCALAVECHKAAVKETEWPRGMPRNNVRGGGVPVPLSELSEKEREELFKPRDFFQEPLTAAHAREPVRAAEQTPVVGDLVSRRSGQSV
jgi:hypothetical protein